VRKGLWLPVLIALLFFYGGTVSGFTTSPEKISYISPQKAYERWLGKKQRVVIIDVRTPEEYTFIGHPEMSYNIPVAFFTHHFDFDSQRYSLVPNENFVESVASQFISDNTIIVLCRSHYRSEWAAMQLWQAGYEKVFVVQNGFEGQIVTKVGDPNHGQRKKNGWRDLLPWTYDLDPERVFKK
jgi:rhodanese-related sulfurtransferase